MAAFAALWLLHGLGGGAAQAADRDQAQCRPAYGGQSFICGPSNVEDMVRIPNSPWVIASSLAGPGVTGSQMYLINTRDRTQRAIDPFAAPVQADPQFDKCPGKLEPGAFQGQGLDVSENPPRLYAVNHGGRESVEIFDLLAQGSDRPPALRWAGCILAPDDVSLNAVTPLPDGGVAVTRFYDRRDTQQQWVAKLFAGEATGLVLEWHAGQGWSRVPESEMGGANGLLVSPDGKTYFIAAWSSGRVIRLSRHGASTRRDSVALDFQPDNLRWDDKGQILVAGQVMKDKSGSFACPDGKPQCLRSFRVARIDPTTLRVEPVLEEQPSSLFNAATVAIDAGDEWWIGTMHGDRIKRVSKPAVAGSAD